MFGFYLTLLVSIITKSIILKCFEVRIQECSMLILIFRKNRPLNWIMLGTMWLGSTSSNTTSTRFYFSLWVHWWREFYKMPYGFLKTNYLCTFRRLPSRWCTCSKCMQHIVINKFIRLNTSESRKNMILFYQ